MARVTVTAAGETATVDYTIGPATPGPSNTGVRPGVTLREHRGDLTVTAAGTVLQGLDIYGYVNVKAKDVVVRDCIIRGGVQGKQSACVMCAGNAYSLTIEDTEIVAQNPSYQANGIFGWNITARRLNIHGVIDQCHFYGAGNVTLENSWLHDNLHYENDPGWGGKPSHDDSIQIQSGTGYRILGNRLEGATNAAIMITQDAGAVADVMIRDNWLDGGACTVNIAQKSRPPFSNIDVVGNVFGISSKYGCHVIRPPLGDINTGGNTVTDGRPVRVNFHK